MNSPRRTLTPPQHIHLAIAVVIASVALACAYDHELDESQNSVIANGFQAEFTTPADGATVSADQLIVRMDAIHTSGIASIDLYLDGALVRRERSAPYEWGLASQNDSALAGLQAGAHELRAELTARDGARLSVSRSFTVASAAADAIAEVAPVSLRFVRKIQVDPRGTAGGSDGAQFNSAGTLLAVSNDLGQAFLYDPATATRLRSVTHFTGSPGRDEQINNMSFSTDGLYFATGMNNTGTKIWTVSSSGGSSPAFHLARDKSSDGLAFSPNGQWLAIAAGNVAEVHDWSKVKARQASRVFETSFNSNKECNSIDFSPDSSYLFSAGDSRIKMHRTSDFTSVRTLSVGTGSVKSIRVSPDGSMIVGTGNSGEYTGVAQVYRVSDGTELAQVRNYSPLRVLPNDDDDGSTPNIEDACWSADGKHLLTGSVYDGVIHVYRTRDWSLVGWAQGQARGRQIEAIDCSANHLIASAGDEGYVYLHELEGGESTPAFLQSATGSRLLVLDPTLPTNHLAMGGFRWEFVRDAAASGGNAVVALPNQGANKSSSYLRYDPANDAPKLDFMSHFVSTGTHYVWVRLKGGDSDNSVHVTLDERSDAGFAASGITATADSSFTWTNRTSSGSRATLTVSRAGIHTVNLRMREDGTRVDALIITPDPNFTPTGSGPAKSPLGAQD